MIRQPPLAEAIAIHQPRKRFKPCATIHTGMMHGLANRPRRWPSYCQPRALGPAARVVRQPAAAGLKPSARLTKPFGLEAYRAKPCITPNPQSRVTTRLTGMVN